jgi:hypothetical protein
VLVYGDRSEQADPRVRLGEIDRKLRSISAEPPGLERHSALRDLLIDVGRVLQGVADAQFEPAKGERWSTETVALADYLQAIAELLCRSEDREFEVPNIAQLNLPEGVELKVPEGYAYYALYPEAYVEAARTLDSGRPVRVVGIRSIGTSLAAVTAGAVGAPRPVTVRPFGPPYARRIAISDEMAAGLLDDEMADFLIVDEGPGQSGSSFCAVADWLESRGVSRERIIFLPSHGGAPGPCASEAHRTLWQQVRKVPARFDARMPLAQEVEALEDISHGQWRSRVFEHEAQWPAVNPAWERSKFLALHDDSPCMFKFAGLNGEGARKLERARILHSAGLVPEPIGLADGFLIERWVKNARPLAPDSKPLEALAHYIGTRARLLPAVQPGASLHDLLQMAKRNVSLGLGETFTGALERWNERLPKLSALVQPIETDGKLERHEWLQLPDGRLLKSDALDHCQSHDLIGCQDVTWDIAGAAIEFDLEEPEIDWLADAIGMISGHPVHRKLLRFMTVAYLALRFGQASLSCQMVDPNDAESGRLDALAGRYRRRLEAVLSY